MKAKFGDREVEIIGETKDGDIEFYIIKIGQLEMTVQKKYIEVEDD